MFPNTCSRAAIILSEPCQFDLLLLNRSREQDFKRYGTCSGYFRIEQVDRHLRDFLFKFRPLGCFGSVRDGHHKLLLCILIFSYVTGNAHVGGIAATADRNTNRIAEMIQKIIYRSTLMNPKRSMTNVIILRVIKCK